MTKYALAYLLTLLVFGTGIVLIIQAGKRLQPSAVTAPALAITNTAEVSQPPAPAPAAAPTSQSWLVANLHQPLSLMLMQLIVVVLIARLFGALFTRLGQPSVIGEMLAGIVLGPSLFGTLFPHAFDFVFPLNSLGTLRMLSQVGVILFMFVVGMELDVSHLRGRANTAVMVSHMSIILPYFLGMLAAYHIYDPSTSPHTPFLSGTRFSWASP